MKKLIRESSSFIKFMNEAKTDEERKQITATFVNGLNKKPMSKEEKARFMNATVGDIRSKTQIGSIIENDKKDMVAQDMVAHAKQIIKSKNLDPVNPDADAYAIRPIVRKPKVVTSLPHYTDINEALELDRTTLTNNTENIRLDYAKGIVKSIKLYGDLMDKAKNVYGMEDLRINLDHHIVEDRVELEKATEILDKNGRDQLDAFIKSYEKNEEVFEEGYEATDIDKEILNEASGNKLLSKIKKSFKAVPQEIRDARLYVDNARGKLLTSAQQKTYDRYKNLIAKYEKSLMEEQEYASLSGELFDKEDLGEELTKKEKKLLDKEKDIEDKNEVDDDNDTSYGASSLMSKYVNDTDTNLDKQ